MTGGSSRRALIVVAVIGFAVGIAVSIRFDLFARSEAISLFGGAEKAPEPATSAPPWSRSPTSPDSPSTWRLRW